jgi:iron complex outermembrane receptor protein
MKKMILLIVLLTATAICHGQFTLRGIVTDQDKQPLPGATVVIENSYYGTSTGIDGKFELNHLKSGELKISISFMGFESGRVSYFIDADKEITVMLVPKTIYTEEVMVEATRALDRMPVAFTNLSNETLQSKNMGQDLPYMLASTPSFVASSDAGTGIGYTSFRIRGTDMNRINVTINGIPLNDAESHATFFVDQPDLTSTASNIQVQRGVGTSSNGGAAFGATINLQTFTLNPEPYALFQSTAGSFNTLKNAVTVGTGLLNKKFSVDVRLSKIKSDGFIDRAWSNLKSFFVSGGYYGENTVLKANVWSGWEETYQAWNGIPSVRLHNDQEGMLRYEEHGLYSPEETSLMLASNSRTYNLYTYENQIDHYQQDHYQLHFSHRFSQRLNVSMALHYTFGRGYYEQYESNQKFSDYGLPKPNINGKDISRTDLIRRKWLDNDFYGSVFSVQYRKGKLDFTAGGGWNSYTGHHFGKLVWAEYMVGISPGFEWYRSKGLKKDMNGYAKILYRLTPNLDYFADIQYRNIDYCIAGNDDDLRNLDQQHDYHFLNPKNGITYRLNPRNSFYVSGARSNREPNRDNFVDTRPGGKLPEYETLNDLEAGWSFRSPDYTLSVNIFDMFYHNQLVLTGQINDVGAPVMANVNKSYRYGMEIQWGFKWLSAFQWDGNLTLSRNKIADFTEYVDDWDAGTQKSFRLGTTDLAFSPGMTANSQLAWIPGRFSCKLVSSYTAKQFIDNSSSRDRALNAYFVNNFIMDYSLKTRFFRAFTLHMMVNNLFNTKYESNAWVYSYYYGGARFKMDGTFPQAGRNFMVGMEISL